MKPMLVTSKLLARGECYRMGGKVFCHPEDVAELRFTIDQATLWNQAWQGYKAGRDKPAREFLIQWMRRKFNDANVKTGPNHSRFVEDFVA